MVQTEAGLRAVKRPSWFVRVYNPLAPTPPAVALSDGGFLPEE